MNNQELVLNYGNLMPVDNSDHSQFVLKGLVQRGDTNEIQEAEEQGMNDYLKQTSNPQEGLGLGTGSDFNNSMKQFVLDKRSREEANAMLLHAKDRQSQYESEFEAFKNLENSYTNMNTGEPIKVDYTGIANDDASFLKQLHQVEAGGKNPTTPNASGYIGMYQQRYRPGDIGSIWAKKHGYTPQQILANPKLQNQMMIDQMGGYKKSFAKSGIPVNNYTLFLAHNQGMGGAKAMMSGKLTPVIRRNIRNQGIGGKSDYELIQNYHRKFKPRFSGSPKVVKVATKPSIKPFTPGYITNAKKNVVRLTGSGYNSNGVATSIPEASKEVQSWFGPNGNLIL